MDAAQRAAEEAKFQAFVDGLTPEQKRPSVTKAPGQRVFELANGFYESSLRSLKSVQYKPGENNTPIPAAIVNLAFAAELYFKALIEMDGSRARGHDLTKLFAKLSPARKAAVAKDYEALTTRKEPDLLADLASFAGAFHDWRYIYEQSNKHAIALHRLVDLVRALFRVTRSANPTWISQTEWAARLDGGPENNETLYVLSMGNGKMFRAKLTPTQPPTP